MRAACGFCFAVLGIALSAGAAEPEFPYLATINADDVYVRSGPGKNYYPTDKLPRGEEVEVYRHDPGGWLAIRPPHGSFSWVSANRLKPTRDNLAVVESERVVARVGSTFGNQRDVIQVRLDRGEEVELLNMQPARGDGAQTWFKIAPPAGEFRWVSAKYVDRPEMLADEPVEEEETEDLAEEESGEAEGEYAADEGSDADYAAEDVEAEGYADSDDETPIRLTSGDDEAEEPADDEQAAETEPRLRGGRWQSRRGAEQDDAEVAERPVAASSDDPYQQTLNDLEVELSAMVAEDPSVWSLDDLRRRAVGALNRGQTALERGRARLILGKLDRFEEIKRQYDVSSPPRIPAENPVAIIDAAAMTGESPPDFDAQGRLMPVVSQRLGAPSFALLDESGQVAAFVTPAPGIHLQPHVGRQVGIHGQRGFLPELNKPHVTASRIEVTE